MNIDRIVTGDNPQSGFPTLGSVHSYLQHEGEVTPTHQTPTPSYPHFVGIIRGGSLREGVDPSLMQAQGKKPLETATAPEA